MRPDVHEALCRTVLLARDFVPDDVSDDAIVDGLRATNVAVVADAPNLSSGACQSSVITLVQLLVATGIGVRFVGPDVRLARPQPPWTASTLFGVFEEIRDQSVPASRVVIGGEPARGELSFVYGDTAASCVSGWRLRASPWEGALVPLLAPTPCWAGDFPVGGLAVAALAAAEPFKAAVLSMFTPEEVHVAQLKPVVEAVVRLAPDSTPIPRDLGRVDCISGGAIIQAALHALLRVPGLRADVRVFEPELLDLSNFNRYALARMGFRDLPKLNSLIASASPTFRIGGVPLRYDLTVADETTLAPAVLVGTDNIPSRWLVQGQRPTWLGVGATSHFQAMASEHEAALESGCAGCAHPTDDGVRAAIPTVSFVSYWAGLMVAARLLRRVAGVLCDLREQVVSLFALRLDDRRGQWRHPVPPLATCPVARHELTTPHVA